MSFARLESWNSQKRKLGFDCANPSVHFEGLLDLVEERGLSSQEIWIASLLRMLSIVTTPLLLSLNQLPKDIGLGCKHF